MEVPASALTFSVHPPDYEFTARPGFLLRAGLSETGQMVGMAEAFEGYTIKMPAPEREIEEVVVEPDTLHLRMLRVYPEAEDASGGPLHGVGTALAREVFRRGLERGLMRGRADVINARMLRILEKLETEGTIADLECYGGRPFLQPVGRLRLLGTPLTSREAKELLNMHSRPDRHQGVSSIVTIRTLFSL